MQDAWVQPVVHFEQREMALFEATVTSHGASASKRRSSSRPSASKQSSDPVQPSGVLEGYLEKYTEAAGKFQRRWFVLDTDSDEPALRYSGSSGKGERSAVPLERIRDIRPGFDLPVLVKSPNLEFQFTLSGSRRVMRLRAPTVSEAARWVTALERECTPAQRRLAAARRSVSGEGPPGSPRVDDGLPTGWRSASDATGRTFYFNKATGERSWNHPMAPPPETGGGVSTTFGPTQQSSMGQGRPVYGREHDPPPKAKGVRTHNVLELHVHELGFFGVSLDQTADPTTAKTYIRVSAVDPGSEAHRQLPQLVPGTYLHTIQGRAVGGLHPNAIVNHLRERPLVVSFSFSGAEVDEAAEEQARHGLKCPFETTFVEPVGTPLGIRFMEYESKLGPQHYLCIESLSEMARLTHPELRTGLILTKVNGVSTARIPTTDKVKELLMQRPVRVSFTDRMADVETSRTMDVMHAAMKWKAFVKRCKRRRAEGYVLGPGGVVVSAPPGKAVPGTPLAAVGQPAGAAAGAPPGLPEGDPPEDQTKALKAAAKQKKEEAKAKKDAAKQNQADAVAAKLGQDESTAEQQGGGVKSDAVDAAKKTVDDAPKDASDAMAKAKAKKAEKKDGKTAASEKDGAGVGGDSGAGAAKEPVDPLAKAKAKKAQKKDKKATAAEKDGAAGDADQAKAKKAQKKDKKATAAEKDGAAGDADHAKKAKKAGGGDEPPPGMSALETAKWKKKNKPK